METSNQTSTLVEYSSKSTDGLERPSQKSYATAVCLSAVFGLMGVQHLYLKRWGEAAIDIGLFILTAIFFYNDMPLYAGATLALDMLHSVVVTSMLFTGNYRDGDGDIVCYPGQKLNPKTLGAPND